MNGTIASVGDLGNTTPTQQTYKLKLSKGALNIYVSVSSNSISSIQQLASYIAIKGNYGEFKFDSTYYASMSINCDQSCFQRTYGSDYKSMPLSMYVYRTRTTGAWSQYTDYVTCTHINFGSSTPRITDELTISSGSGWSIQYV